MKAVAERRGGVAELVINGPPLNLFDRQMILDMETALAEVHALAQAGDVRAMLLRAEGRTFCGGVDVHEFQGLTPAGGAPLLSRFFHLVQTLEALPIPTLAVVHGLNLTIGFELALGTDLLWAAEDASFGLVEATVGLTPGAGGTQRVAARAGSARAAEMVFTGDVYPAAEMYRWGVVNRLLPAGQLLGAARGFAAGWRLDLRWRSARESTSSGPPGITESPQPTRSPCEPSASCSPRRTWRRASARCSSKARTRPRSQAGEQAGASE